MNDGLKLSLVFILALMACGAPTDRPEDCRSSEFYNERTELCTDCPAPRVEKCREGCGYEIEKDSRGCPVAECAQPCLCESGKYFASETSSCQSCDESNNPPAICYESDSEEETSE